MYFLFEMSSLKNTSYFKKQKSSKSLQKLLDSTFLVSTGDGWGHFLSS